MTVGRIFSSAGCFLTLTLLAFVVSPGAAFPQSENPKPDEKQNPDKSGDPNPARKDAMGLTPALTGHELSSKGRESYQKGITFLLGCQNKDGSWGSALPKMANLKDFGFKTTNKGSNDGVRHACTAIIAKALLRKSPRTEAEQKALDRAVTLLLSPKRFAYSGGEAFNTWGYGYKLSFLVDYLLSPEGKPRKKEIEKAATTCIIGLKRYQLIDGGWNYYAGPAMGGTSMSFNTANFMMALHRASKAGLEVPKGMVEDAAKLLRRMKTKRGGFVYDARFLHSAGSVNELSAASRTAACTEALVETGHFGAKEMLGALEVFNEGENWLEDGRKLIQPHTAVHQVSGYFFFYGYFYLSEFMARMGKDARLDRWERNAWTMIRTQDADGSWWDTPAAGYGDKWGTGFALLVLQQYFDAVPGEAKKVGASRGN